MSSGDPGAVARLRAFARVQVRSGYLDDATVRNEVVEAAREDLSGDTDAESMATEVVDAEITALIAEQADWSETTDVDRLEQAFAELSAAGLMVLRACDDHWEVTETLSRLDEAGEQVRGVVYFTHTDVWHAVDHQMLELNLWHGDTANAAPGDELLEEVLEALSRNGLHAVFDEGRIEVSLRWQWRRTPTMDG
ncbi:MAG: DUF6891 domain-containing protein [Nocardioidaceae bacterium]